MKNNLILICIFLLLFSTSVFSHATSYQILKGGIGIQAKYSNNTPISFSEIKIFAPNSKRAYQEGQTDAEGRFFFFPNKPGKWGIIINDGMGHGINTKIDVSTDKNLIKLSSSNQLHLWQKLIFGIGIIFLITIFFSSRINKNAHS